jgi:hypothetical protein
MSTKEAEAKKPPAGSPYTGFKLGVPKESFAGERRVATTPQVVSKFSKLGLNVCIEKGAGEGADISDKQYAAAGATVLSREEVFQQDMIFKVNMSVSVASAPISLFSFRRKLMVATIKLLVRQSDLPLSYLSQPSVKTFGFNEGSFDCFLCKPHT